jgi:hypothetical protein
MGRPKKDPRQLKNTDVRIPVTLEQKAKILQASIILQAETASWIRDLAVNYAEHVIKSHPRSSRSKAPSA